MPEASQGRGQTGCREIFAHRDAIRIVRPTFRSAHSRFAKASSVAALPSPASAAALFAKARQMQEDREREASEREAALELQRLDAIERDEEKLWRGVDELIAGKTIKAYDEAVSILKDLRALALHKQRLEGLCAGSMGSREIFAAQPSAIAD